MFKMNETDKQKYISLVFLGVSILFYLFFAFYNGVEIAEDSSGYISMALYREPLYCTFLAALRFLCGFFKGNNELYLTVAIYIQSLLAAFAAWSLAEYLQKEFHLCRWHEVVILLIPMITALLCYFSVKVDMYSISILTESIAMPMFLIFVRYLLDYLYHNGSKALMSSVLLSFLLISTRKQMVITLIFLVIAVCCVNLKAGKMKKAVAVSFMCIIGICGFCKIFDYGYNYIAHGAAVSHSGDNRFQATVAVYVAEREYGEGIVEDEARELFYQIYDACEAKGYLKHSASKGLLNKVQHFHDNYDYIQLSTMWPMVQEYVAAHYQGNDIDLAKKVDEIVRQIFAGLMPKVWSSMLLCSFYTFLSGIVVTAVGIPEEIPFMLCAPLAYLAYFFLTLLHIKKEGMTKLAALAIFIILFIVVNVTMISLVIFCSPRYTLYNTPLLYIGLWILMVKNIKYLKPGSK